MTCSSCRWFNRFNTSHGQTKAGLCEQENGKGCVFEDTEACEFFEPKEAKHAH